MQDDERVIITTRGYSDTINKELLQRVCEFISGGTRIIPHDVTHFPAYHRSLYSSVTILKSG